MTTEDPTQAEGLHPYAQRQQLMALACALAIQCGLRAGRYTDPEATEGRFSDVLQLDLPTGQVTIHVDNQDPSEAWRTLPIVERTWDGHSQTEAFAALSAFVVRVANEFDKRACEGRVGARLFGEYTVEPATEPRTAIQIALEDASRTTAHLRGLLDAIAGMVDCDPERGDVVGAVLKVVREVEASRIEASRSRDELAQARQELQQVTHDLVELRELWTGVADGVERALTSETAAYANRLDIVGALQRVAAPSLRPPRRQP